MKTYKVTMTKSNILIKFPSIRERDLHIIDKNLQFRNSAISIKNNIIIKLSENYTKESLKLAMEFLYSDEFRDVTIIDARIKDQIILND